MKYTNLLIALIILVFANLPVGASELESELSSYKDLIKQNPKLAQTIIAQDQKVLEVIRSEIEATKADIYKAEELHKKNYGAQEAALTLKSRNITLIAVIAIASLVPSTVIDIGVKNYRMSLSQRQQEIHSARANINFQKGLQNIPEYIANEKTIKRLGIFSRYPQYYNILASGLALSLFGYDSYIKENQASEIKLSRAHIAKLKANLDSLKSLAESKSNELSILMGLAKQAEIIDGL